MGERTFIIGGTVKEARDWCRANGVKPYARTTVIIAKPSSFRWQVIRPTDRVVWHSGEIDRRLVDAIRAAQQWGLDAERGEL